MSPRKRWGWWRWFVHSLIGAHGPTIHIVGGDAFQPYVHCLYCNGWGWYDSQGNLCVQGQMVNGRPVR